MAKAHQYSIQLKWTGNKGDGTKSYQGYDRSYEIFIAGKPLLKGSSDPAFRGDATRHNPEEMMVMALSSCHMLWFLHLCSVNEIDVQDYIDYAEGTMIENPDGSGQFTEVILKPRIKLSGDMILAGKLHSQANQKCFIANSVNFTVRHEPEMTLI